jgi:beta-mannosidase
MVITQDLTAGWFFEEPESQRQLKAQVPGCIHQDLLRHRLIPDPFYGRNELDLQWIGEKEWRYRTSFTAGPALRRHENIDLLLDGLDTVAEVRLNGRVVLRSDNMFHRHRLPVKARLVAGPNQLEVRLQSPLRYIRKTRTEFVCPREFNDPEGNSARIRKEQCNFGWDWGPRLVTSGVWQPVRLEGWSGNRIESIRIEQRHRPGKVELAFQPELARSRLGEIRGTVSLQGVTVAAIENLKATIPNPRLWWPNGHGRQPLYTVNVELVHRGKILDTWTRRIGLRDIQLDLGPDAFSRDQTSSSNRFGFRVNGKLIFSKGANWIPAHTFVAGLKRADYAPLLQSAAEANMNMLRVWGGGIYEHDTFYDLCDELGLLVWQDFMFACTCYPADRAFLRSVRREVLDQVPRLRHHACLALWCGNNETVLLNQEALKKPRFRNGYRDLFLRTIPAALRETDPVTPYIHSSPCFAVPGLPESKLAGWDEHDWNVWHARKPVAHYETTRHRFVSEFGMQSYPSPEIARTFCPENELNIFSAIFENHQKNAAGNQIIFDYVSRLYRFPRDYRAAAFLSQLNQGHCMKVAVEHFRRTMPLGLGALYWQLNDCWPVASWSSLEFGGKWKALHHLARRFFAPVLVSIRQEGGETAGIGNYATNDLGPVEIHTVYEGNDARDARLDWKLCRLDGGVVERGVRRVRLQPNSAARQLAIDFSPRFKKLSRSDLYLRAALKTKAGRVLAEDTAFFTAPRFLQLQNRPIFRKYRRLGETDYEWTVSSATFHHRVCLEIEKAGPWFSDNFFDLHPGEPKTVRVRFPRPPTPGVLRSLTTYSLVHSYA